MKNFKLGDLVKWESQAASSWITKEGVVVAIVPAGQLPQDVLTAIDRYWKRMFDASLPRKKESYLVEVRTGKTGKATPKLYWPHASKLISRPG